jgi:predicted amidophosphoribosyltransferase
MAGKNRQARERNVSGVFAINHACQQSWKDRPVLLIDDVMTTGATLQSCADRLISSGLRQPVSALVFARVL